MTKNTESLLQAPPADPLFSLLAEANERRNNGQKVLEILLGVYRNDDGSPHTMPAVAEAQRRLGAGITEDTNPEYLPAGGNPRFVKNVLETIWFEKAGLAEVQDRIAAIGTSSGTAAISICASCLERMAEMTGKPVRIHLSDPTFHTHIERFSKRSKFETRRYPYLADTTTASVQNLTSNFDLHPQKINCVMLQASCHNPTGIDYTDDQVHELIDFFKQADFKNDSLVLILDLAYQGEGRGFLEDSLLVREAAKAKIPTFVCYSLSKNSTLYKHRTGALLYLAGDPKYRDTMQAIMSNEGRNLTGPPSAYGEEVFNTIHDDSRLKSMWLDNVTGVRNSLNGRRTELDQNLAQLHPQISTGHGFFSVLEGISAQDLVDLKDSFRDSRNNELVSIMLPAGFPRLCFGSGGGPDYSRLLAEGLQWVNKRRSAIREAALNPKD